MLWLFIGIASLGFIIASFLAANENPNEKDSYFPIDGEEKSIIDRFVKKMGLPESDFSFIPPFSSPFVESMLISPEQMQKNAELTDNPPWAQGDIEKVHLYYAAHREGKLDRLLGTIACHIGVIIHGDVNQEQLALNLQQFDIQKLLCEGPYSHSVLSQEAQQLIFDSLNGKEYVLDIHLHNLGYDEGNFLNPKAAALSHATWNDYFTFLVLRYANGMSSSLGSTHEARKRLQLYAEYFPKLQGFVLPIHKAILPDGKIDWENTGNFLTNRSALLTAVSFSGKHSNLLPAVSVHPFDLHWKEKLLKAHAKGIRLVKWMPPQSIPPDSDLIDHYYETIKELGMIIIAHAGPEHAIPTHEGNQHWSDWGNPLRFRRALQMGANVILAHSGNKDLIPDLDLPDHPLVPGIQLFLRLALEAHEKNKKGEWTGKLYGDLAAVTTHYGADIIKELLLYANEEGIRFVYGSDYPYTNLIKPQHDAYKVCAEAGLLNPLQVKPLQEIRAWNPLLANYIFTKQLEFSPSSGEKVKFPENTFDGKFPNAELKLIDQAQWQTFQADFK